MAENSQKRRPVVPGRSKLGVEPQDLELMVGETGEGMREKVEEELAAALCSSTKAQTSSKARKQASSPFLEASPFGGLLARGLGEVGGGEEGAE
ncbi:hypothetical protein COCNU_06G013190 [Cocos nucifera]|uniref:Uncharacterized protein n=1 Tax=Cocos nucifera TaxID=13894 RepID=A0A8K0ICJ9_COCNU|nr:hypothetical protein COCNU_06G013190 [Cocos nucifera]